MTVITNDVPRRRRALPGKTAVLSTVFAAIVLFGKRAIAPHKASLANLASIPMTLIGTACIDFAAFHLAHGWGWFVTGISFILIEHIVSDEGDQE